MRYLTVPEVERIHAAILVLTGGRAGVRDRGALESAVGQPLATFGGEDLYPDLCSKATALCFSLVNNHPFLDGNKRVAHAAMEVFLRLNGVRIEADTDDQERVMLDLASGSMSREDLLNWLVEHINPGEGL